MNQNLTEIAFVLDRSGSMACQTEAAISGFNEFLRGQKEIPGEARFTLVLFDDQYDVPVDAIPIAEVVDLDTTTFVPRGSTALLDAVGRTIVALGERFQATPEAHRPGQVIVAVLTDGYENASRRFTHHEIAAMIAHQRDVYRWQFLFLGANQDAIATAAAMNIPRHSAMTYLQDEHGVKASHAAMGRKVRAMRKAAGGGPMSVQEQHDVAASLSEIGDEEDRKSRRGK